MNPARDLMDAVPPPAARELEENMKADDDAAPSAKDDQIRVEDRTRPARDRWRELPSDLVRRDRRQGEIRTRSASIQNFCRECLGWDPAGAGSMAQAVRECTSRKCHLWPWRNGAVERD